ncbi:MAG: acyl-CoA thioesterase [Betaproteobacteria bacterium]|nr:acyl-CoA thioesterase [Betaproteobacteria bacterium]
MQSTTSGPGGGRYRCRVEWGDCDPAGIIFYPTYFRWMDAASWAFVESAGYDAARMRAEHLAMPLVSAQCDFLVPALHGDRCEVRTQVERVGTKSFTVAHEIVREDGTVLARGSETRVWGRFVAGPGSPMKGEAVPEAVRGMLAPK